MELAPSPVIPRLAQRWNALSERVAKNSAPPAPNLTSSSERPIHLSVSAVALADNDN